MTFSAPLCFALALVVLASTGVPVVAQKTTSLPSNEEGTALVERSNRLTNFRELGSAPFHLNARSKSYGPKGKTIQGTYELWWASPDRWHEEINWGNNLVVTIVDKNRLWETGADANRLDSLHVTRLLDFPSLLRIPSDLSVDRVQAKQIDGVPAICMRLFHFSPPSGKIPIQGTGALTITPPNVERSACWDIATDLPLRIDAGSSRFELGAYAAIGNKQFPHKIRKLTDGKTLIDVELDSLELLDLATTTAFTPPSGMGAKPWCPNMVSPTPLHLGSASGATSFPGGGFITPIPTELRGRDLIVFRVDETGRTVDVHAFTVTGEVSIKDRDRQTLLGSRFRPATCDGTPVQADFLMPENPR